MKTRNLALATVAFGVTFWAWNLIGPLSDTYTTMLALTSGQQSMLIATPVLVGSLGRIPAGMLADRYGGRLMFGVLCFLSVIPVLAVGWSDSYVALLC